LHDTGVLDRTEKSGLRFAEDTVKYRRDVLDL
jgi:hypothetical protein